MMRIELPFDKRQLFEAMTSAQLHTLILQDDDDSKLALWYVLFFRIKDKLWLNFQQFFEERDESLRDFEEKDLRDDEYNPGTCTPLYDAIGLSVNHLKSQVAPVDSVLVTIITDGYENDSKEFDAHAVSRLIEEMKGKGWLFTYIGANQDAIAVARAMNIHNAMNFVQDDSGTKEMFRKERKARERFNARCFEARAEVMECCASMPAPKLEDRLKTLNKSMAESANYFEEYANA